MSDILLEIKFLEIAYDLGGFDVDLVLDFLDRAGRPCFDPFGIGFLDGVAQRLELVLIGRIVEFDNAVARVDLGAVLDDPLDDGGSRLGAGLDTNDDVAILGGFERTALDDVDEEFFLFDSPGRSGVGLAAAANEGDKGETGACGYKKKDADPDKRRVPTEDARLGFLRQGGRFRRDAVRVVGGLAGRWGCCGGWTHQSILLVHPAA